RSVGLWPFKKKMVKNLKKHALLKSFQANGFFLIDTCNYPVDKLSKHERRVAVLDGASRIMNLVRELNPRKIIIVKSNVYGPVKRALYKADYHKRILNKTALAFPSHGNQKAYRTRIGRMIADGRVVLKLAA
ncbi:MAG TPA: hypothetical protein VE177_02145, partial [Candidatus Binatus sp.]|nr:hypothetical protein [Candidatus Binatus sp.]